MNILYHELILLCELILILTPRVLQRRCQKIGRYHTRIDRLELLRLRQDDLAEEGMIAYFCVSYGETK